MGRAAFSIGLFSVRSTIHMPDVVWSLYPLRTTSSNILTINLLLVRVASHPASHNTPRDKRDHEVISLNTWAFRASIGIVLRIRSPLREDVMVKSFGIETVTNSSSSILVRYLASPGLR